MSATEKPFEREPRYLVIKVNDALAHLSSSEIYALGEMGEKITNGRSSAGKLPLVTVVVEQDWPEFELVWEMIKARVTGKGNDARRVVACLNACEGISTENLEDNLPVLELADRYNVALKQRDELLKIAKDVIGMLENCSVESGVCHCGDDMARHSSAMSCGHAPVDMGSTYAANLYEKARAAIASVKGGAA